MNNTNPDPTVAVPDPTVAVPFLEELPSYQANEQFAKDRTVFTIIALVSQTDAEALEAKSKYGARWLVTVADQASGEISVLTFKANEGRDKEMNALDEYLHKVGPLANCRVNKRETQEGNPVFYINRVPQKQA